MKYSKFYLAFENKFRGSSLDVNEKLVFYDGLLEEISSRFSPCQLLDIGCGRGEWLAKCSDLGINSIGIDNNDSMFNTCNIIHIVYSCSSSKVKKQTLRKIYYRTTKCC